jgi:pimeloyl-ACP methyl ester carboxylesterase
MAAIVDMALQRFFSPESLIARETYVAGTRSVLLGTVPEGYTGCCAAIRDFDSTAALSQIKVPTMVIVGDNDVSTPLTGSGEILVRNISSARLIRLPAAHLSKISKLRSLSMRRC